MNMEEYLIGVLAAEVPASFNDEALKAQAIASRTYATYKKETTKEVYDVVTSVANQSYLTEDEMKSKWNDNYEKYYNKIKQAISETENLIMTQNNNVICSYFFAISNGYTEDSLDVFSSSLNYIKSTESSWDKNVKNYEKTITMEKNEFCEKLNIDCENIEIKNIVRSKTNHISKITINNKEFTGINIRKLLSLRSTDFDIKINDNIEITTRGYGHGVGMSQYGANEMAKEGYTYEEILKYYYNDIEITKIDV